LAQREGVPHHLIDVLPPSAEFSAGHFHTLGRQAVQDILSVRRLRWRCS
jgi:tRNA A37 N6-isopentenylltransferase MiaA